MTVFLDANGNGALDPEKSAPSPMGPAAYAFTDLGAGDLSGRRGLPGRLGPTAPAGGTYEITMTSGLTANGRDFGNRLLNVAPVNTVPGGPDMDEDTALVFSSANGNGISIRDVDAGGNPVEVTLTATHGVLTLSGTAGLTFSAGEGAADGTMTFREACGHQYGPGGVALRAAADFNGAAGITITTNDLGNTGAGGPLSDTDTVALTITAGEHYAPVAVDGCLHHRRGHAPDWPRRRRPGATTATWTGIPSAPSWSRPGPWDARVWMPTAASPTRRPPTSTAPTPSPTRPATAP